MLDTHSYYTGGPDATDALMIHGTHGFMTRITDSASDRGYLG